MSIAQVEKIYTNEREREEFNSFRKQRLKEQDVIHLIFENAILINDFDSMLEKIHALHILDSVSGMLNELTPEQREAFEEAVKRRPLFK